MTTTARAEAVRNHYVHEGVEYTKTDGLGTICRHLQETAPSIKTLEVYRSGRLCMVVDVPERAGRTLSETNSQGIRYKKYSEKPKFWEKDC